MKKNVSVLLIVAILFLMSCHQGGGGTSPKGLGDGVQPNSGEVAGWQMESLGQEGHGGDAIVCFDIPVERALYKINTKLEGSCTSTESCSDKTVGTFPSDGTNPSSGVVWRMTEAGRKSIRSAKPLEQYLGERIASKKAIIDQLNQMPLQKGYEKILSLFTKLPAVFNRMSDMHKKLGWLHEDGIASEYGLVDINDSGFVNENEIDRAHCKELQAVVRRDNQLWYDTDILSHFDHAGRILIQLHEEIYAWGKAQDKINLQVPGLPAHETSTKTRRLILKILDLNVDTKILNENLKAFGFSTMYWENQFHMPTEVGFYMNTDACIAEQQFLKNFFKTMSYDKDFWFKVERLFTSRYLKSSRGETLLLRHNFPDALSNMMTLMVNSASSSTFIADIINLQQIFERPESCEGRF